MPKTALLPDCQLVRDALDALYLLREMLGLGSQLLLLNFSTEGHGAVMDLNVNGGTSHFRIAGQLKADLVSDAVVVGGCLLLCESWQKHDNTQEQNREQAHGYSVSGPVSNSVPRMVRQSIAFRNSGL